MSKLQDQFDALLEERAEIARKFQAKAQELFKETTKEFFDKNPGINAIIWTQYTPYFNDGDTCEFSVGEPYFTNANSDQLEDVSAWGEYDGEDEGVWAESEWTFTGDSDYARKNREGLDLSNIDPQSIGNFSRLIQSGDMTDVMEAMFGDHVRITATRDGFDVDDYSHD